MRLRSSRKIVFIATLIIMVGMSGCSQGDEMGKVKPLSSEAQAAFKEGARLEQDAQLKYQQLYSLENVNAFPDNREQFSPLAQETIDQFSKSAEQFGKAADRYEQLSKLKIDEKVREFFSLNAQYERKFAAIADLEQQMTKLWVDESVSDLDTLKEKLASHHEQLVKTQQETKELQAKAAKIASDYPDKFK
jgi:hypothetical protein